MACWRRAPRDNRKYRVWCVPPPSVIECSIVMVLQDSCTWFVPGELLPLQYSTNSMGSVNLVVIVESARSLITKTNDDLQEFHIPSIVAVAAALGWWFIFVSQSMLIRWLLGVKFLLFLYCYSLRNSSSQVHVLWEDHRNDLWINTFGMHHRLPQSYPISFQQAS